jgi:hypothetical protein
MWKDYDHMTSYRRFYIYSHINIIVVNGF